MPSVVIKHPQTGEVLEVTGVPEGMSPEAVSAAMFSKAAQVPSAPATAWDTAKDVVGQAPRGVVKGFFGGLDFMKKGVLGLPLAALSGLDKLGVQGADDIAMALAKRYNQMDESDQAVVDKVPAFKAMQTWMNEPPKTSAGGYSKAISAGVGGSAIGGVTKLGSLLGGASGGLTQTAQNAELGPGAQLAAGLLPFLFAAGYKSVFTPTGVKEVQSAMAGTKPEDISRAMALVEQAKDRGITLSPAQAFGEHHPLVSTLNKLGSAPGSSEVVKPFMLAQEKPASSLQNSISNIAGDTRLQDASNKVAKRATDLANRDEKLAARLTRNDYEAAATDKVAPEAVQAAIAKIRDYMTKADLAKGTVAESFGTSAISGSGQRPGLMSERSTGIIGPDGKAITVPEFLSTAGQLKSVRDDLGGQASIMFQAGKGTASSALEKKVREAITEAMMTSPKMRQATEKYASVMENSVLPKRGEAMRYLAGKQGTGAEVAPVDRVGSFLDPVRFSAEQQGQTMSRLADPKESVMQALLSSYLKRAGENATAIPMGPGVLPGAKFADTLRGAEGSGKQWTLDALVANFVKEQNAKGGGTPLNSSSVTEGLNSGLDVLQAAGRGRQGLSSNSDFNRVNAESGAAVIGGRAASFGANPGAFIPLLKNVVVPGANKKIAEALLDPSGKKLNALNDYDKNLIIQQLVRQAATATAGTGAQE